MIFFLRRMKRLIVFLSCSRRCILTLAVGIGFVCVLNYFVLNNQNESNPQSQRLSPANRVHSLWNSLGRGDSHKGVLYVVDTPTCKIPAMYPWDESIKSFLKPGSGYPVDCRGSHRAWTFMKKTELILNETAVQESGYSLKSIICCYRTIQRVEQPLADYDINADNYIKYSEKCYPIRPGGQIIDADFIRIHCVSTSFPLLHDVVYRDFFAIAQPNSDRLVTRKLETWKAKEEQKNTRPPNVVIVGIDNNSRMNSYRTLNKSLEALKRMGAVEMLGYTKVGENTFPNTVPFISGYSEDELKPVCYSSNAAPQDECPFVWKAFDKVGYLTVAAEDTPYLGGFNYLKTGFLRKPTDFYLRPVMLAVLTYMPRADYYHTDCIGRYMTEEFVFNYILDILHEAESSGAPVFVHSWLTSLAHLNYNNLQFGDDSISQFLQLLEKTSNTIFFFMSDHGQRYGPIRETPQGWYEDKMPTQWVYLPPNLRKQFPEWYSNLRMNSHRLTSHFDVYKTLLHVLKTFDDDTRASEFYNVSASQKGQSLFELVPDTRVCDDAGITVNHCACQKPKPTDINNPEVKKAAQFAVTFLGTLVPQDVCAVPTLKSIESAGVIKSSSRPVYLISIYTDPGDFLFEVNVERDDSGEFIITTDFLRMNKITRPASCVSTPLLERYCYCK